MKRQRNEIKLCSNTQWSNPYPHVQCTTHRKISWACELKRSQWWNEKEREVVKPSANHVNNVKKGVELGKCIGVENGRKKE